MTHDAMPVGAVLILAEMTALPVGAALRDLLDRMGLLDPGSGSDAAAIKLRFGNTALCLSTKSAKGHLETEQQPSHAIGDASTSLADDASMLHLWLGQPDSDRGRYLQQVQHLCAAAAMIGAACDAGRLYWSPARLWSPVAALVEAVAASEGQGLPPVLHLVAFLPDDSAVETHGLAHFCGVELRLVSDVPMASPDLVRRLARLAVHAMLVGPLSPGASVAGLEPGEIIMVCRRDASGPTPCLHLQLRRAQ